MRISSISKVLTCLVGMVTTMSVQATVWTVSNDPNRPAQFTALQAAVDAASPNDTLLVTGSSNNYYPGATVVKPLVFFGEGIEANGSYPVTDLYALTFSRFNSSLSSSGSRVYGCRVQYATINGYFNGGSYPQMGLNDFIFERCWIYSLNIESRRNTGNITVRNCLFNEGYSGISLNAWGEIDPILGWFSNIIVTNCIFSGESSRVNGSGIDFNGNLVVRNCLFVQNIYESIVNVTEGVFENNIWFRAETKSSTSTNVNNCTFNNNLTYLCNNNTLPPAGNIGSGNIVNQNPMFNTFPALGANFSWAHNYGLQAGSPALGTGTNGTDIGINSGNAPVTQLYKYAKIPAVTSLTIPVSSVPVGGTLQINIQAVSRD
jgi:hypothetical protein